MGPAGIGGGAERIEAPTTLEPIGRPAPVASFSPVPVYEPDFGLLASDNSWRTTWATIIAGRFSASPYGGLLFVEQSTGYAELYETDGSGRIVAPPLGTSDPLGGQAGWTHIVPGFFGPSGLTGLLLYDSAAGTGQFLDSDGQGRFLTLNTYSGWRTTWSHIVAGRFVYRPPASATSPLAPPCLYSGVFFYSASENYAEIWGTDGTGLAGTAPYQVLPDFSSSSFTHVLAADFHWTPGYIDEVPTLTDLFCYDSTTGHGEMFRSGLNPDGSSVLITAGPAAASDSLPQGAASVAAGNFGGSGNSDLVFYNGTAGELFFYSFQDISDTQAQIVPNETQSGVPAGATLLVAGVFWRPNEEDHWFADGPAVSASPPYDPDWRFGTGGFSDLLFYISQAGTGEFYFHEPLTPPALPLDGYVTSQTSLRGTDVATGSVLPGEPVSFHVSSQVGAYSIAIYQQAVISDGATERMVATIQGLPDDPLPLDISRTAYRDGAGWPPVTVFTVPADWPSGLYLARVTAQGGDEIDLPFAVRAPGGSQAGILVVLADTTYNAYNDWGGRSAYGSVSGANFAGAYPSTSAFRVPFGFELSFVRPFRDGWGNVVQSWELPFIQWLARRSIPFDVCTARDVHFGNLRSSRYRLVIFAGHHEYWTWDMRTDVESFVQAGGNVAFFTGNVSWWQVRLTPDGTQMTCYKVEGFDPVSATPQHAYTTGHWFSKLVNRPETALTGVSWNGSYVYYDQDHRFTVKQASHWAFTGTGLGNDGVFGEYSSSASGSTTVNSVCGPESDPVQDDPGDNLVSPPDYTLAAIYGVGSDSSYVVGTMGAFSPASGAGTVFNAATIDWALGLTQAATGWNTIDQITANVIAKLSGYLAAPPWISVSQGSTTPGGPVTAVLAPGGVITLFLADPGGSVYTVTEIHP